MKDIIACTSASLIVVGLILLGYCLRKDTPNVIVNEIIQEETLSEWELMKLAIIKTESEWKPLATNGDAWGLMQITPIYVKEVNRILGEERYCHEDAFDAEKTNEMFEIMQGRHNPTRDIDKAIASHNPTATSAYSLKVRRNMDWVKNYEELRQIVR